MSSKGFDEYPPAITATGVFLDFLQAKRHATTPARTTGFSPASHTQAGGADEARAANLLVFR
jgi:hypothetical protein